MPDNIYLIFGVFLVVHPFVVSLLWTLFGLVFFFQTKKADVGETMGANFKTAPTYSVLIPFYNEIEGAIASARSLSKVVPRPEEIILVDDGSNQDIVGADVSLPETVTVLRLEKNKGKAGALNYALGSVNSDLVVCLDADTTVVTNDWTDMIRKFDDPAIGALSGKIWPSTPMSIVQQLQHMDYVAIIGLIKSAETVWGSLLTVSGAFVAYRRSALEDINGWSEETPAEDIDASWRLQTKGWRIGFDPHWICNVEMAPTLRGLWKQRKRWSSGLGRTFRDHLIHSTHGNARQLPVAVVSLLSLLWILCVSACGLYALGHFITDAIAGRDMAFVFSLSQVKFLLIGLVCFTAQIFIAILIDGKPWKRYITFLPLVFLFPVYYWFVLFSSFIAGFPCGFLRFDKGSWSRTVRKREADQLGDLI